MVPRHWSMHQQPEILTPRPILTSWKLSSALLRGSWRDYRTTSIVSEMITDLGWEILLQRRTQTKLVMVFRITHSLIYIQAPQLLHPAPLNTRGLNALPGSLLQDRCMPVLILSIEDTSFEPASGVHRHSANLEDLQARAGRSLLTSRGIFLSVS